MVSDNGLIFMIFISLLFFFGPGAIYLIDAWARRERPNRIASRKVIPMRRPELPNPGGTALPQGT